MNREIKFRARDKKLNRFRVSTIGNLSYYNGQLDNPEWQQYTGLKDKNGKEIYEGDILKPYNPLHKGNKVVEWDDFHTGYFPLHSQGWSSNEIEVIGNIYETPELLE